jgi:HemX protein
MKVLSQVISYSLPVLYLVVIYIYYLIFSEKNKSLVHKTTPILLFLIICHLVEITTRNIAIGSMPLSTTHDAYSFIAFSVLVVYMISELGLENRGAGLFILSFALVFELLSAINMSWEPETNELLANKTFILHASMSITGYTGLLLSAIYSLMYIIQNNNLKKRNIGMVFQQLPSLTYMEKMNRRSILTGIILLGIGIMLGHYQMMITGEYMVKDMKVIITDVVWILYIIMYLLAIKKKWSGEKMAYMSLYGFIVLIVGGGIVIFLSESFHEFN